MNEKKIKATKKHLILTYSLIYAFSLIVFWCFMGGSDAMAYGLIFLYTLIPITTFVISLLIGKHNHWGKWKWVSIPLLAFMHMMAEYLTFSMKNMIAISFKRINMPNDELFLMAILISVIGMIIGIIINHKKDK